MLYGPRRLEGWSADTDGLPASPHTSQTVSIRVYQPADQMR